MVSDPFLTAWWNRFTPDEWKVITDAALMQIYPPSETNETKVAQWMLALPMIGIGNPDGSLGMNSQQASRHMHTFLPMDGSSRQ
jgi:hypothetical protein